MFVWLNPRNWLRWWRDFILSWVVTIPSASIGPAIPSVIFAGVVLSLVALTIVSDPSWRMERLRGNLQTALVKNNQAEVELLCRRLLEQNPNDKALQFQLASAMAKGEERPAAVAMMKQLALEDDYPAAARWLMSEEFKDFDWVESDSSERKLLGSLLKIAVESGNANGPLVSAYVDYLIATGNFNQARPYLEALANENPVRATQAAAIYRNSGDEKRAEAVARRGLEKLETLTTEEPENAELYIAQTRLLVFLDRYEDASTLLSRGFKITKDDRLRQAAAETLVVWSRSLPNDDSSAVFARRLQLLQSALSMAPKNPRVLQALIPLVIETAEENSPNVVKLRKTLVSGVAPELSHFIRGTTAMLNGNSDEAAVHLEMASKHMPEAPVVMNNLAVALASGENPDLEKSLALVDAALVQSPTEPYMHETRGQILLKMGRHHDAIVALEKAMPAQALAEPIHRSLALAYREIGQTDVAVEHEQILEKVRRQSGTAK